MCLGVHCLWVCPYIQWLADLGRLTWMVCEMGCKWALSRYLMGCFFQDSSKHPAVLLWSFNRTFSLTVSLEFKWCNHTVVLTRLPLQWFPVLFHQRIDFHVVDKLSIVVLNYKCNPRQFSSKRTFKKSLQKQLHKNININVKCSRSGHKITPDSLVCR